MTQATDAVSTLLILGARGDLASRLLLPGLGRLLTLEPERRITLVGSARAAAGQAGWKEILNKAFADAGGPAVRHTLDTARYVSADVSDPEDLHRLLQACDGVPALYFALPPAVTARAVEGLGKTGVPEGTVLALEKPFGTDTGSAAELNRFLAGLVPDEQVFRVDHFLGKSTVLNLLGLRLTNRIFEPMWNRDHIAKVDIVYEEELGLEGRAGYYDRAGAMVDMIQSHLLQVMALVAMEPPATVGPVDLRAAKSQVLKVARLWAADPAQASRRARYTAGTINGRRFPSYTEEEGVDPARETETLAEVVLEVTNRRWAGVPFTLRSGKAVGRRRQEIVITFHQVPVAPGGLHGIQGPTVLRISLGSGGMSLELNVNGPGDPFVMDRATPSADFGPGRLDAYGEVLQDILDRDPTLSIRAETAEQSWRIIDQVRAGWKAGRVPLEEYPAGSPGPASWAPEHAVPGASSTPAGRGPGVSG